MMPGMDGFEVCRRLKSDLSTAHIPVLMVTALDQPADRVRGLDAGADEFLTKPVDEIALLARVRSLARLKVMIDELRTRAATSASLGVGEAALHALSGGGENGRILLVDDRPSSADRTTATLRGAHHVDVESDPQEALFRGAEGGHDLFVISLGLQNSDALRLCSQIRSLERTRAVSSKPRHFRLMSRLRASRSPSRSDSPIASSTPIRMRSSSAPTGPSMPRKPAAATG
jgi:two-component system cell cycle response regulator